MKRMIGLLAAVLLVLSTAGLAATTVNVDFNVTSGQVDVNVHRNKAKIDFTGIGGWTGNLNSATQTGGYLDTNVLVEGMGNFKFSGMQKLAGYTNDKVTFETFAYGQSVLMNNRFDNSMYVVQLERVDNSKDFLKAAGTNYGIGWKMGIEKPNGNEEAGVGAVLYGQGNGAFDTNQWHPTSTGKYGWGNPNRIDAPNYPGYYTPTNTVSAFGNGVFVQSAHGTHSLQFNGFNAGSGSAQTVINFNGGLSGAYSMHAS